MRSRTILALTDGKIGDEVHCRAVALGLQGEITSNVVSPRPPWVWAAPWGPVDPKDAPKRMGSPIAAPFPDIVIASGRRAIPYARRVKSESGDKTFVVLLKAPRIKAAWADIIWTPSHDRLEGANVFSTMTAPHMLSEQITAHRQPFEAAPNVSASPTLGVLIGGAAGRARFDDALADQLASSLEQAAPKFDNIVLAPSRRTPPDFMQRLSGRLGTDNIAVLSTDDRAGYIALLESADALIVTADSHNMVSEALAAGVGVYVLAPIGIAPKLAWFVEQLKQLGSVCDLEGGVDIFTTTPIDATPEIIAEIERRIALG